MTTTHVVMVQVNVELTKDEIGKVITLTGVTGNPTGTVIGLEKLVEEGDPKVVILTMTSEQGTLVL